MDRCIDSFLQHVASSLKNKFGDNLSRVAVVFPNKRANLFLNEYLARPPYALSAKILDDTMYPCS